MFANRLHAYGLLETSRYAEFVALIAISCTLFLFLHTQSLTSRLREMEDRLQEPSSLSAASGLSGNSISQANFRAPKTNCQRDDMLSSPQISVNLRVVLFATPSASRLLTLSLLSEKSYMHTRYPKHEHTRCAWGSPGEQQAASNSLHPFLWLLCSTRGKQGVAEVMG
uniref:Uncharacterized protein n=1 Tax=Anopheles melas TaxID=34690 RepID=A0A182TTS5_9DIPT